MTAHTATGDHLHDLAQLATQRAELDHRIAARVAQAREAGRTWEQIGAALGVTKQAAQKRYRGTSPTAPAGDGTTPAWVYVTGQGWVATP